VTVILRLGTVLLLGAALLFLAAGSADAKTLRWANGRDVFSLDPYARQERFLLSFDSNIYEPLVRRGEGLSLEPALATRWSQVAPDRWRFELRRSVRFQDGAPFTADDVVFSFARARGPGSSIATALAGIRAVTKVDDFTVAIQTEGLDPILPAQIAILDIMSARWCAEHDAERPAGALEGEENYASNHADGTGPFMLKTRRPDRETILVANPRWWDHAPANVDRVVFMPMRGRQAVAALLAGRIDLLSSVPPQFADRIAGAPGVRLVHEADLRTIFLGFDLASDSLPESKLKDRNPLRDRRVRLAIAQAVDENAIASKVMRGVASPAALLVGPGVVGFDPALNRRWSYDPAAAKALLAQAGYRDGFSTDLACPNDRYVNDTEICRAVVTMLAKVSIKLRLHSEPRGKYFTDLMSFRHDAGLYLMGWIPANDDADDALLNLAATRDPAMHRGDYNFGGYSNAALDALLRRIGDETDASARSDLLKQALALVKDDVAYLPLHQQQNVWATRDHIALVQPPDGSFPLRFVHVN
jgi:peptide/nickel transport system substrate-binding protein